MEQQVAQLGRKLTEVAENVQARENVGHIHFYGDFSEDFDEFFELRELLVRREEFTENQKLVNVPAYLEGNALNITEVFQLRQDRLRFVMPVTSKGV